MHRLRMLIARLAGLFGRPGADQKLNDEIALHLELETARNVSRGMTADQARRAARLAFGAIESMKEEHRDHRGIGWVEALHADLRHAVRTARKSPALTIAVVLTLALAVGINGAIFSVVNAVVLRPLPFPSSSELTLIGEDNPEFRWSQGDAAPANFFDWREQTSRFEGMAAYPSYPDHLTLTGQGEPHRLIAANVTGNFFAVLGVPAALGRTLEDRETWRTGVPVVVISHALWTSLFHGDPAIVGRSLDLDGRQVQVVGVMPLAFAFPFAGTDVWVPVAWHPEDRAKTWFRRAHFIKVIARLKPHVTLGAANSDLQSVVQRLRQTYPATNGVMGATMTSLQDFLGRDVRKPLATLIAAVGILLLIACANIGNLLLVHAEARRRESALRIALGAGRRRLVRQALSHSALLSLLGGALGIAVAWGGMRLLVALRPPRLQIGTLAIDIRVVGFLFAITALSGLIFGIGPALWIGSRAPQEALKESSRGESRSRRMRLWGDGLVVAEVGMALLLGVGASLLIRSFVRLAEVDPGFDPTGVLAVSLDLPTARYDSASKVLQFYRTAEERLRALPGVTGTGLVSYPPLTNSSWSSEFAVAGRPQNGPGNDVLHREISPDYPQVMRIPLLRGRALALSDGPDAPAVVLINDVIARRYFPSEDPIGKRVAFDRIPDSTSQWYTIVGVVGSERQGGPEQEPRPEFLAPFAQAVRSAMTVMVRSKTDPAALIPAVRRTIALTDPDLAISGVQPMTTIRNESVARQRFLMTLLFAFAACGLALCAVGVYGVAAHTARGRQREMGIRIALGARSSGVRWLVVGHTLRLAAAGVAIGIGAALVLTRLMESLLFDVTAGDPATYLLVPAVLFSTAFLATWLPAARASRADPMESLRTE